MGLVVDHELILLYLSSPNVWGRAKQGLFLFVKQRCDMSGVHHRFLVGVWVALVCSCGHPPGPVEVPVGPAQAPEVEGVEARLAQDLAQAPAAAVDTRTEVERRCGRWVGPVEGPAELGDARFEEGFAAAGVRERSAIIWARTRGWARVQVRFSPGPRCPEEVSAAVLAQAARGHTLEIPLRGLEPGTLYRYRLEVVGGRGPTRPGWFSTAPERDEPVRLAFSADISARSEMHTLLGDLIDARPQLYLSLGDWPYADLKPKAETLKDYRDKHISVRRPTLIRAMARAMPIHAVWDDHEILNDWDGRDRLHAPEKVASGTRAWREFFPVVGDVDGEIYRRYNWGPQVEIFQLDCRSHRHDNHAPDGEGKTMLGQRQLRWLLEGLSRSRAAFKLILTTVPLDHGTTGKDHWIGFKAERRSILAHITDEAIGGVVFLTADQHWLSVHHLQEGPKEWQVGPLAQFLREPSPHQPPWVLLQRPVLNFGLLDYLPGAPPRLRFQAVGEGGEVLFEETIEAGIGRLSVEAPSPLTGWRLEGAHHFFGVGSQNLPWVTPGTYTLTWVPALPGQEPPPPATTTLKGGGAFTFETKTGGEHTEALHTERFARAALGAGWGEVIEARRCAKPVWKVVEGVVEATGNCRGDLKGRPARRPGALLMSSGIVFGQGTLAIKFQALDDDSFGLVYSADGKGRAYRVAFNAGESTARLMRLEAHSETLLAERVGFSPPTGRWAVLAVERRGDRHRIILDGQVLLEATDAALGKGAVGLYAWGMRRVRFDDLHVFP